MKIYSKYDDYQVLINTFSIDYYSINNMKNKTILHDMISLSLPAIFTHLNQLSTKQITKVVFPLSFLYAR